MTKSELLDRLREKYRQWEMFLNEIDIARMDQPGVTDDWSMKDVIAHLTGWNRWLMSRLQSAQRGESEPFPPWPAHLQADDDINAWIYATNRRHSVREVLYECDQIFHGLLAAIESLPDAVRVERIEPDSYLVWVQDKRFPAAEFFDHFRDDHEPDVRAWLAREQKH